VLVRPEIASLSDIRHKKQQRFFAAAERLVSLSAPSPIQPVEIEEGDLGELEAAGPSLAGAVAEQEAAA